MGFMDAISWVTDVAKAVAPAVEVGSLALGTAGTLYGMLSDPYEDTRRVLEMQAEEERRALASWRQQQEELFKYQLRDAETAQGLQNQFRDQFGDILSGKIDVASSPMFASQFAAIRNQMGQAMRHIEETMPAGGAKERALQNVRQSYLDRTTAMAGDIQKWIMNWAGRLQVPYGGVGGAMPQTGGGMQALLGLQQSQAFSPKPFFDIAKGWRDVYKKPAKTQPPIQIKRQPSPPGLPPANMPGGPITRTT